MKNKILLLIATTFLLTGQAFGAWNAAKPANDEKLKDTPALIRANWDAIATGTDSALQITNAKVASSAAIVDTKLATISTAGKVDGTAITDLAGVPSGAGALPLVNGGTGQTTRQAALNALSAVSLSGTSGQVMMSNGTNMGLGLPSDLSITSQAQGDIIYYNGTNWVRLAPGTSGMFLKTLGAGANPAYSKVDVSSSANITGSMADSNLATISTAGKVSGAALTSLSSIPSGAGVVPSVNLPSFSVPSDGSTKVIVMTSGSVDPYPATTPTKMLEITVNTTGTYNFSYTTTNNDGGNTLYTQSYKNGVAYGTLYTNCGGGGGCGAQTRTDTSVSMTAGDKFQVYGYVQYASGGAHFPISAFIMSNPGSVAGTVSVGTGSAAPTYWYGIGAPATTLGSQGDLYLRNDGSTSTTLYVKTAASTWTAK